MPRRIRWALLIVVVGGIGLLVGRSTAPASEVDVARRAEADVGLDRVVPELSLEATPISQVIDRLRAQTHANIAVNWREVESEGIDRTAPITLRLWNLPLRRVLDLVCDQAGGGVVVLGWRVDRGVIEVSTKSDLDRDTVVRIYDVRDIIKSCVEEQRRLDQLFAPPSTQPKTSGNSLFQSGQSRPGPYGAFDVIDELTGLIQETIDPESWREAGGSIGSIRCLAGRLIVTGTPQMHVKIDQLLALIRTGRGEVRVP